LGQVRPDPRLSADPHDSYLAGDQRRLLLPIVLIFMVLLINKRDPDEKLGKLQDIQPGGSG